jgi:hypothetical protein
MLKHDMFPAWEGSFKRTLQVGQTKQLEAVFTDSNGKTSVVICENPLG